LVRSEEYRRKAVLQGLKIPSWIGRRIIWRLEWEIHKTKQNNRFVGKVIGSGWMERCDTTYKSGFGSFIMMNHCLWPVMKGIV
jgi:hypothetical protein